MKNYNCFNDLKIFVVLLNREKFNCKTIFILCVTLFIYRNKNEQLKGIFLLTIFCVYYYKYKFNLLLLKCIYVY